MRLSRGAVSPPFKTSSAKRETDNIVRLQRNLRPKHVSTNRSHGSGEFLHRLLTAAREDLSALVPARALPRSRAVWGANLGPE